MSVSENERESYNSYEFWARTKNHLCTWLRVHNWITRELGNNAINVKYFPGANRMQNFLPLRFIVSNMWKWDFPFWSESYVFVVLLCHAYVRRRRRSNVHFVDCEYYRRNIQISISYRRLLLFIMNLGWGRKKQTDNQFNQKRNLGASIIFRSLKVSPLFVQFCDAIFFSESINKLRIEFHGCWAQWRKHRISFHCTWSIDWFASKSLFSFTTSNFSLRLRPFAFKLRARNSVHFITISKAWLCINFPASLSLTPALLCRASESVSIHCMDLDFSLKQNLHTSIRDKRTMNEKKKPWNGLLCARNNKN